MKDTLKKEGNVGYKLRLLHNQIHKRLEYHKEQNESECGELTRMQRFTIGYLYRNRDKEIYQRDIETEFAISRATASNMITVMERKGLLVREAVEHDARLKKLVLTEQSIRMHHRIEEDIWETERLLTQGMSVDDKRQLHLYLDAMIQNLVAEEGVGTTRCCENDTK